MSKDMKPKKFWVYMGDHALLASSLPVSFNDGTHVYHVIELEPTTRMMDELAEALEQRKCDDAINNEGSGMFNKHDSNCAKCFILEKYRKFKEGLK